MAFETSYFPPRLPHPNAGPDHGCNRYYRVCQGDLVVSAYNSTYYPSIDHVLTDLKQRIRKGEEISPFPSNDLVVWRSSRIMATIHENFDDSGPRFKVRTYEEEGNDPGPAPPLPGWPGYEEWAANRNIVELDLNEIKDPFGPDDEDDE